MSLGNRNGKKIRNKIFIGFGLASLYAMSFWLFFICMLAMLNGGYVIVSTTDYNESLAEIILMFIGLIAGAISIFFVVKNYEA